ncbi:hypothetical protein [Bradyrhizobium diazoefficiens]|uniref:Uncharacterized protein n=1 Tax=Bradyrhizobium diazoefficiens TaxID=1355477 RepID=A0A810BI67_9BRAD|nr:hypothetical protein [Bradyrhizobium diazoefficiens]WLB35604.1 hypothetical protein QIH78_29545 [Bradyrhizobium diazoefficiens]WLC19404.1 hypothetical protein QIH76_14125 [Bradyrhizobium diazoefficiens]BCE75559.1 hypothetical protein XF8B_56700 [Bradyrhizobium diazoefficiens]
MARNQFQALGLGGDKPPIRNERTSFAAGDGSNSIVTGPTPSLMVNFGGDPLEALPPEAREQIANFERQRGELTILSRADFENEQALRAEIFRHEARITELRRPRGEGGFGLDDSAPQVIAEQRRLDQKRSDLARLLTLKEARSSEGRRLGELLRSIEQAIVARPAGTVGRMINVEVPAFRGNVLDAIENRRRRLRELRADLARIRHAPHPSAARKAAMIAQVDGWAQQGRPDAAASIEHGEPITWPLASHRFDVYNVGPGAVAFGEFVDLVAFTAWWDREGMIERLSVELDAAADDAAALGDQERREQEQQVLADILSTEFEECRLVALAQSQGLPAEYRPDCDARAVLAIDWIAAPPEPREGAGEAGVIRHIGQ